MVNLPQLLRPLAGGATQVQVEGASLRQIVAGLEKMYPGLRGRIADDHGIRPEIMMAVGGVEAFGLDMAVAPGDEVHILPAIAGGAAVEAELGIGAAIRTHRRAAGLSQSLLATHVGTSQARISRIEAGVEVPSIPFLLRVGEVLGIDVLVTFAEQTAQAE